LNETAAATLKDPLAITIALVATVGLLALGHPWSVAIPAGVAVLAVHFGTAGWLAGRRPLAQAEPGGTPDWKRFGLTPKEIEVMPLVVSGLPYREIARRTFNSERTIENHVDHIKKKLGVHSRAEIIAFALRQGLLPPADPRENGGSER
jgi:DNA-binding CsgD family transcriptional regulator